MKCMTWILVYALSMHFFAAPLFSAQEKVKEFLTLRVERFENQTTYPIFDTHGKTILQRIRTVLETSRLVRWDEDNLNSDIVLVGHLEIKGTDLVIHMELLQRKNQTKITEITEINRLHIDVKPIADEIGGKLLASIKEIIVVETPVVAVQPVDVIDKKPEDLVFKAKPDTALAEQPPRDEPVKKDIAEIPQDTIQVADLGDQDEIPPQKDAEDKPQIDEANKESDKKDKDILVSDKPKVKEEGPPKKKKKTLLYVGLGVLVLGGGVLALTLGGKDDGPPALMDPPARPEN